MRQQGFVLLAMMLVIAAGSTVFLVAIGRMGAVQRDFAPVAERNLRDVARAAEEVLRRDGAFPLSLDALGRAGVLDPDGSWRRDPYAGAADLDYRTSGSSPVTLTVASRGIDGQLGTGDDLVVSRSTQMTGRARTRNRLRLLRTAYYRSSYMDAATMSAFDRAQLRTWIRELALAYRERLHADTARSAFLDSEILRIEDEVARFRAWHGQPPGLPDPPQLASGPGGLLEALALPETLGVDGFGRPFEVHEALGFLSVGGDGRGGTIDDL